jgi:sphingolipid C9-methyltransferase
MEQRHDWAKMVFTPELFKYVLCNLIPEVIVHSQSQDEEQVRGHYDRKHFFGYAATSSPTVFFTGGDDFYEW